MTVITAPAKGTRLLSVDVLRGITIGFMILVNDNGDERVAYGALKHAYWNGFTPTDLVFPTFLFIMGLSLFLSYRARRERGESKGTIFTHTLRRFVLLFLFGLAINCFGLLERGSLRYYGVLQRIAICYLLASLLLMINRRAAFLATVTVLSLVGYWLLVRWVPVPGHGMPIRDFPLLDRNINLVAWLDRKLLYGHLYEGVRDPEGLISDLPALGTTLLGVLTAIWLRTSQSKGMKGLGIAVAAVLLLLGGYLWNFSFPINKKMWTSSYVLWAGGWSMLALAVCYFAVEIRKWRGRWTMPALVFGSNAIAAYVLSEVLAGTLGVVHVGPHTYIQPWIYQHVFAGVGTPAFGSLLYSLSFVLVCWLVMLVLYRRRLFIKL